MGMAVEHGVWVVGNVVAPAGKEKEGMWAEEGTDGVRVC